MSIANDSISYINGVELKDTVNGYHDDGHDESNLQNVHDHYPLIGNGVAKVPNHRNISKLKSEVDISSSLPFPLLPGENVEQRTHGKEANVILTNYRLFVCMAQCFYNVPVRAIEYVEMRELLGLHVNCKDGKVMRIGFDSPEECSEWWRYITSNEASQSKTEDLFAFRFFKYSKSSNYNGMTSKPSVEIVECEASMYVKDIKRMGFNIKTIWRTTEINSKFEICETYPKFHIIPKWIDDEDLKTVAQFRSLRRFPSVIWRNKANGAIIARSSQPELGWFGWRCEKDEQLLSAIAHAANLDSNGGKLNMTVSVTDMAIPTSPLLLIDARSYAAAVANRAKGGGCEYQEYYPNCEIQFMGLPNIHAIRKSFQSVRALCLLSQEQSNWYSALEATRWLYYLSALIRSTLTIVEAIDVQSRSTLVHCSDGWDRTTQLVSLAELLLDPYYRTIKGFQVLIEREWLEFGHKFANRCGHSPERDLNERSPVFFQWLDAVYQCIRQFPSAFEFNEFFLLKLVQHVYSCLFGTFLCNSIRERNQIKLKTKTTSVWDFLLTGRKDFLNYLYIGNQSKVLYPSYHVKNLQLWESIFLAKNNYLDDTSSVAELTKSLELTDSGHFTYNSNGSYRKTVKETLRKSPKEHVYKANLFPDAATNETLPLGQSNGHVHCSTQDIDMTSPIDPCADDKILENRHEHAKDGVVGLYDETGDTSKAPVTLNPIVNKNCSENLQENTLPVPMEGSLSGKSESMTDSVRTITSESEHRKSFDDSYVVGKGSPKTELQPGLVSLGHRTSGVRRAHSSPDSPSMSRLSRTKSVPDVMTSSVCVNTDVAKQYPTLEIDKQLSKDFTRNLYSYIDSDGLTIRYNFLEQKLIDIERRHAIELSKLHRKLEIEREARISLQHQQHYRDGSSYSPATFSDGLQDDMLSLPDSVNGERSSVSSVSNDEGWEQVQFDDVQPMRWLPDHFSSQCTNCGSLFTVVYRRHHCRKCGGIFCDACSSQKVSLPEEQLFSPVRVCARCYDGYFGSKT